MLPMTLMTVVIIAAVPFQATAQSNSGGVTALGYARLGYGAAITERPYRAPAIGFGFRGEGERYGLDVSVFNYVVNLDPYETSDEVLVGSRLKLSALRFLSPGQSGSVYLGGGVSWGVASLSRRDEQRQTYASSWHGDGLQVELTTGYEIGRTGDMRLFVQGDASLPLFRAASQTFTAPRTPQDSVTFDTEYRYLPSAVISLGIGWRGRQW
jgi:hypothetical protein